MILIAPLVVQPTCPMPTVVGVQVKMENTLVMEVSGI